MVRVLLFGTYPQQYNGYSKVVYEISKKLCLKKDIELGIFGFQNCAHAPQHRSDLPSNVFVHDALLHEVPQSNGFGAEQVKDVVEAFKPDLCIVYNDMVVITSMVNQLIQIPDRTFKIVAYVDQVYLNQKKIFIDYLNKNVDIVMAFTEYWEENIKAQGITKPTCYLPHGFSKETYFPIPKHVARSYFGLQENDFIILNLNRNQPRKRWDTCLKAFAELVLRHQGEKIKLLIATSLNGAWNLLEIYERELKKRGLTLDIGLQHLIVIDNPQKLSDEDVNILYNCADIGINTCDGEGFGLCNFEQAALGIPQVLPRLGGFQEFLDDSTCCFVEPSMAYYVDNSRDIVCGEALLCDYRNFVDGVEMYYNDRTLIKKHGEKSRKYILENFAWDLIVDKLYKIIMETVLTKPLVLDENGIPIKIDTIDPSIVDAVFGKTNEESTNQDTHNKEDETKEIEELAKEVEQLAKEAEPLKKLSKEELQSLRRKLDLLLSEGN